MPFGTITSQTVDYAPRQSGVYSKSTLSFGDPANEYRIRGAAQSGDVRRASVTRLLEKDVTVGSDVVRKQATLTLNLVCPSSGFTASELDSLATDISGFLSTDTVTRLMVGES